MAKVLEFQPGPSVFPSGEPGVSGGFWGSQEGCQGPSRPSGPPRAPQLEETPETPPSSQSPGREAALAWASLAQRSPALMEFQILKDDAVKVLHSICQQIWNICRSRQSAGLAPVLMDGGHLGVPFLTPQCLLYLLE